MLREQAQIEATLMSIKDGRWLGVFAPVDGVISESSGAGKTKVCQARVTSERLMSFGGSTVEVPLGGVGVVPFLVPLVGSVNPWTDAEPDHTGRLQLPDYPSELPGVSSRWKPGEYTHGVDNIERNVEGDPIREWGGQKPGYAAKLQTSSLDPFHYRENIEQLMTVPHMPGQPVKEMFARLKAAEPRIFEDPDFLSIQRNLPQDWKRYVAYTQWSEGFGVNTEQECSEWQGHEQHCVPAVYVTTRPDTVTLCVGIAKDPGEQGAAVEPGADYDFLEYLYAKDQGEKVIQIMPFKSMGVEHVSFAQYSFVPPMGTSSITPYACFKIRGTWRGDEILWDTSIANPDMDWFSNMDLQEKRPRSEDSKKQLPKVWPDNSWEGNAAKARMWEQMH